MSTTLRWEAGKTIIEIDDGDRLQLMTQSELTRKTGRSPRFIQNRVADGTIQPLAVTETGILLFGVNSIPGLMRGVIGYYVPTTTPAA